MIITDLTYEEALALPDPKEIWLNGSQVIVDTEPAKSIPNEVYKYQARLALEDVGLLPQVETLINTLSSDYKTRFQHTDVWHRRSPHVLFVQQQMGWTDEQLDDLFIAASKK